MYRDPINYFDNDELLKPAVQQKSNITTEGEDPLLQLDDDADYINDDDDEEEDEEDESAMNSADNERHRSHKACKYVTYNVSASILTIVLGSRTERERLEEGIISEAKRMVSFDFVKKYALFTPNSRVFTDTCFL